MKTFQQIYQESYDEVRPDRELVEDMLEDARIERRKWIQYAVLRPIAITLLGMVVLFGGTSVMANNVGFVYGIIERTSPELADLFVPVQESSTKAGICMEVEAVYLGDEDKSAQVLISFRDTQGDRIQGPVDLYDSYDLSSKNSAGASWVAGGCSYVGYDQETGKAYYQIQLSSDVAYERSKMTFRVRELLLHHESEDREIPLEDIVLDMPTKYKSLSGGGIMDWEKYVEYYGVTMEEPTAFMETFYKENVEDMPDDPRPAARVLDGIPASECAVDDFTITGLGYRDNMLQLQICMGDCSHADRHVFPVTLTLADGSERMSWFSDAWHEYQGENRLFFYEFYIPCTPEELEGAHLYGHFSRTENSLKGNWKVTFRVEEKEEANAGVIFYK